MYKTSHDPTDDNVHVCVVASLIAVKFLGTINTLFIASALPCLSYIFIAVSQLADVLNTK